MARYAERVPAPSIRQAPAPAATPPQRRGPSHPQRAAMAQAIQLRRARAAEAAAEAAEAGAKAPERGGLPARLRAGIEALSGLFMGDVRVHRDSPEPAKLGALAYTKGTDIHLGPGQEQHLPHEAWHAVQQKQGRVTATAQMKGEALNQDPGLESEADRMGAAAHASPPATGPLRHLHGGSARVVQAKIRRQGETKDLEWSSTYSSVVRRHIEDPTKFILDKESTVKSEVIYLLRADAKYLLGEEHESGVWEDSVSAWPEIPKMREGVRVIPREPSDTAGALMEPANKDFLPLESAHAALLFVLLTLHTSLNDLCMPRIKKTWTLKQDHFVAVADTAKKWLIELEAYAALYADWAARLERSKLDNARLRKTHAVAVKLQKNHEPIRKMKGALGRLRALLEPPPEFVTSDPIETYVKQLDDLRFFVPDVADELTELLDITDAAEAGKVMSLLDASFGTADYRPATAATNPAREKAMTANIAAARAPLLVQLGRDHLQRVGDGLRDPLNVVKIDQVAGDRLEKHTRKT